MNKQLIIIISLITLLSCSKTTKFELKGTVKNVSDSTLIKFIDGTTQKAIDSTFIINEKFRFDGDFKSPTITAIYIDKTKDYLFLWVENKKMTLSGVKGKLNKASITGSKTQKDFESYNRLLEPITQKRDSIANIFRNPNISDSIKDASLESTQKAMEKLAKQELTIISDFIIRNPDSYLSISILKHTKKGLGKQRTQELYSYMDTKLKQTDEGIKIAEFLKLNNNVKIGNPYIDFTQENSEMKSVRLSESLGKYTLLEFWASWCLPCRETNPDLVKLYKEYEPKDFQVVGVSLDSKKEAWIKAIKKDKLPWINLSDLKGRDNKVAITYDVGGIPDNFLIDPNGVIIGRDLTIPELTKKLENIFEKKASR